MAEVHESIVVRMRQKFLRNGYHEAKNPMPTYRPDLFARCSSPRGKLSREIVVEAEIESTLFLDHTAEQLVHMDEYIRHQRKRRVPVIGYLAVPGKKNVVANAKSLLDSLFPFGSAIVVLAVRVIN
jgi:hypothetical protein